MFAVKQPANKSEQSKCLFVYFEGPCYDEYSALRLKWQNLILV